MILLQDAAALERRTLAIPTSRVSKSLAANYRQGNSSLTAEEYDLRICNFTQYKNVVPCMESHIPLLVAEISEGNTIACSNSPATHRGMTFVPGIINMYETKPGIDDLFLT
jgi:hypothetical protein